ncbi:MAG: cyclic nucleotide-binding domain-containing protein [Anaerolineae bacterium]
MINLTIATFRQRFPNIGMALTDDDLQAFLALLKVQIVEASEALIIEGTVTDSLYFVWEGELDVIMQSAEGEYKVAVVEQGDLLGEISLLQPGKTTATVRSELGCVALHLDLPTLEAFWETHPHAASVFLNALNRIVAQRIRSADLVMNNLLGHDNTAVLKTAQHKLVQG